MEIWSAIVFTIKKARTQVILNLLFKLVLSVLVSLLIFGVIFQNLLTTHVAMSGWFVILMLTLALILLWDTVTEEVRVTMDILRSYREILLAMNLLTAEQVMELQEILIGKKETESKE